MTLPADTPGLNRDEVLFVTEVARRARRAWLREIERGRTIADASTTAPRGRNECSPTASSVS
jgi:hypothetical protein